MQQVCTHPEWFYNCLTGTQLAVLTRLGRAVMKKMRDISGTYLSPRLRRGLSRRLAEPLLSQVRAWYTPGSRKYFFDRKRLRIATESDRSETSVPYLASA